MSFYVCHSFDQFDPKTGYFILKIDCIKWDETISGPWSGPRYSSLEECYSKSICAKAAHSNNLSSNNYCNMYINNVTLKNIDDTKIIVDIEFPQEYSDTYIEYAFYNIESRLITDFSRLTLLPTTLSRFMTIDIPLDGATNVCAVAFRLVKPCLSESGSEDSGSMDSGLEQTGLSGSGDGISPDPSWQLFDLSSWQNITSTMPMKTYLDIAASYWNDILKYNDSVFSLYKQNFPEWNGLAIVYYEEINDPDGFIAACGPIGVIDIIDNDPLNIKKNAVTFQLYVNTYFNQPPWNFTASDWINTIAHELGHALGIGIFWNTYNNYWLDGNKYQLASNAYNQIIGDTNNNRKLLPLEDGGGSGTTSAHWEDNDRLVSYPNSDGYSYPSCIFDIMVGFYQVGSPIPISNLSKQVLIDMGYESTGNNNLPITPQRIIQTSSGSQTSASQPIIVNSCGTKDKCGCDTHIVMATIDLNNHKCCLKDNHNG